MNSEIGEVALMSTDLNESGYTVRKLAEKLHALVEAGMGDRVIMIGPTNGDDGTIPMATPVVGLEANTDSDSSEFDICWLYPGENKWE